MIEVGELVFEGDKVKLYGFEPLGDGSYGMAITMTIPKGLLCDLIKWALRDSGSIITAVEGEG